MEPTPEQLKNLTKAVDFAVWVYNIKRNTRLGEPVVVNLDAAMEDLCLVWAEFRLATTDSVTVSSGEK